MRAQGHICRNTTIASLIVWMIVVLAAQRHVVAETGRSAGPMPVHVMSALLQEQQPTELVPPAQRASVLPQRDDAAILTQVTSRPQPEKSAASELDQQVAIGHVAGTTRPWGASVSTWEAPAFCHRALYFEDENLERHGRSLGVLQPAASTVHFAGRTLAFPYLVGALPPHECVYTLGRERPGTCAMYRVYRPPLSAHGAVTAGATAAGLSFIVP
jgi:hypothetical protein